VISDKSTKLTLLAIDTAGSACSVAVGRGIAVLAAERQTMRHGHAEALLPMIDRVMETAGVLPAALDGVAVAVGPGGFTGIRVGLGAALGIALALKTRLIRGAALPRSSPAWRARRPPGAEGGASGARPARRSLRSSCSIAPAEPLLVRPPCADGLADYVAGFVGAAPLLIAGDMAEQPRRFSAAISMSRP
jgi:hypothetical protein